MSIKDTKRFVESERNYLIDLVRVLAAWGVIAIHVSFNSKAAEKLGLFFLPLCVPFFYTISLTYFVLTLKEGSIERIIRRIWLKITIPFLLWTFIYLILLYLKSIITNNYHSFVLWRSFFYGESAVQLYFLPQLIMMQILLLSFNLVINGNLKKTLLGLMLISIVIGYLIIGYNYNCFGVTKPLSLIIFLFSAFVLSLIAKLTVNSKIYIIPGILLVLLSVSKFFFNLPSNFILLLDNFPIGGTGLVLISFSIRINKIPNWVTIVTSTTFGVYLSHVLFLEAFEFISPKVWVGGLYYDFTMKVIVVNLIFICSVLFTLALKRFAFSKQLLLGEKS